MTLASPYLRALLPRALPVARVLPPEQEATTASGSRVQAGDSPPALPSSSFSVSYQFGGRPPRPLPAQIGGWAEPAGPRRPADLGAGGVGGRTRATALLLLHHLWCVQPTDKGVQCILFLLLPFFSGQVVLIAVPCLPSLFWAPRSLRGGPGVFGPPVLTARPVGSAAPLHIPGGTSRQKPGVLRSILGSEALREERGGTHPQA